MAYRVVVWRVSRLLVALVVTSAALGLVMPSPHAAWPAAPVVVGAAPLGCLETALTDYANGGTGWTGGDSTWSAPLPDDRELFAFSDTFLGPITPPSRPADAAFVHNSFVVRDATGRWSTVTGGTPERPAALIAPADPAHWFWLGAATFSGDALQVPLTEWRSTGPGPLDFAFVGSSLARFDNHELRAPPAVSELPRSRGIQWGQWVQPDGGWTYVYGVESAATHKYLHVARVAGGDLRRPFSYWTGQAWSAAESDSVRVADHVSAELSVHRLRDGVYLLTTMLGGELFSDRLVGRFGPSPAGPFGPAIALYRTPESGSAGLYRDADVYTYNAHVHPEYSTSTDLVISYDVNSLDTSPGGDVYRRVSIYRPRFVVVTLRWNRDDGASAERDAGAARRACASPPAPSPR
ncbi:DUF4185 domain-containing protein [Mycobacterium saskatchewanense]|uniref:DUF4185 domain-containing protein n=1 Tax=Mycobacterium saskatchewanense TaxID=220927 RepID=UPI0013D8490B|nr:DUF4185 domain-containing protein [Mycobacterium saskatchewanense]